MSVLIFADIRLYGTFVMDMRVPAKDRFDTVDGNVTLWKKVSHTTAVVAYSVDPLVWSVTPVSIPFDRLVVRIIPG